MIRNLSRTFLLNVWPMDQQHMYHLYIVRNANSLSVSPYLLNWNLHLDQKPQLICVHVMFGKHWV